MFTVLFFPYSNKIRLDITESTFTLFKSNFLEFHSTSAFAYLHKSSFSLGYFYILHIFSVILALLFLLLLLLLKTNNQTNHIQIISFHLLSVSINLSLTDTGKIPISQDLTQNAQISLPPDLISRPVRSFYNYSFFQTTQTLFTLFLVLTLRETTSIYSQGALYD